MNDATRAAQPILHPITQRPPVNFGYPLGGIAGRIAIGLVLLAVGGIVLQRSGMLWLTGGTLLVVLGGLTAVSNLLALLNADRRRIIVDIDGVEIRYGFSRRRYRFLDYSDYRISRVGLRHFLTALPIDVKHVLGKRVEHVRITVQDRPALLTPTPLLGRGAPATLLEWQSTLNDFRRAAIAAAGPAALMQPVARARDAVEEARRAGLWRARQQAGAKPSRLSRQAYLRGRVLLTLVFLVLLLAPLGFILAVQRDVIALCGPAGGSGCIDVEPALQQLAMIGSPLLAALVFVIGNALMTVRRANDLDEHLSFGKAIICSLGRYGPLQRRLNREEGTQGTNRFGLMPPE